MKLTLIVLVLLQLSTFSFASESNEHQLLCQEAAHSFPEEFDSQIECLESTELEVDVFGTPSIEFLVCGERVELVTLTLQNGVIMDGGRDAGDLCD